MTNSDLDEGEPLFPYKVGASDRSGPSTKDPASTMEDNGWVDEEENADDVRMPMWQPRGHHPLSLEGIAQPSCGQGFGLC